MNIPKRIVSNGRRSATLGEFNAAYKLMVESYVRLPLHLGEEALPKNPKLITEERLSDYVKKMQTGLNDEQKKVWQKLYSDALMQIKVIRQFFEKFPDAEFEVNDSMTAQKEKMFRCVNKIETIDKAAEIDVPEDCKEYFDKVRAMYCGIVELREYEKAHNLPGRSLEEMMNYAENGDKFAGLYIDGYFLKKQYPT